MIKTLTPYYVSVPLVNHDTDVVCEYYTVKIYIWDGNKTAVPSESSYEITKINASASNGSDKINIARIVNDFIDFNITNPGVTSLENGNNQVWVKYEVYYSDQPTLPKLQSLVLSTKGYGYFLEGENPQIPTNKILLTGDEFKVYRNGFFVMPIIVEETTPVVPEFIITNVEEGEIITYTINFDTDGVTLTYKQTSDSVYTFGDIYTDNPILYDIPLTGSVDVQLIAFNAELSENIYSNVYTVII